MPVIQTAFSFVFELIGVVSFAFVAFVLYLMYTDPTACGIFLHNVNILTHEAVNFIQNIDI